MKAARSLPRVATLGALSIVTGCAWLLGADFGDKTVHGAGDGAAFVDGAPPPGVVVALGDELNLSFSILAAYAGSAYVSNGVSTWRILLGGGATPIPLDPNLPVSALFVDSQGLVFGASDQSATTWVGGTFDPTGQGASWLIRVSSQINPYLLHHLAVLDGTHIVAGASYSQVFTFERGCSGDAGSCSVRMLTSVSHGSGADTCLAVVGGYVFYQLDAHNGAPYYLGRLDQGQAGQAESAFTPGANALPPCAAVGGSLVTYDATEGGIRSCAPQAPAPCAGTMFAAVPASAWPGNYWTKMVSDGNGDVYVLALEALDGASGSVIYRAAPNKAPVALVHAPLITAIAVDAVALYWLEDVPAGSDAGPKPGRLRAMSK